MRVWLAPSRYAPHLGGIETVVSQLALELRAAGDDALVLTHRHPRALPEREVIDSVQVRRLRFEAPRRDVRAAARFLASTATLRSLLDAEARPDVIHLHGSATQSLHLSRYAARRKIPLVLTTHGEITGDAHQVFTRSAYSRWSFRYAARQAGSVTAPSRHCLDEAAGLAEDVSAKGRVVPNGIRAAFWRQCDPPAATAVVLAWGRLERQKGFDRLVAAWPYVRAKVPTAELRIAGDGGERESLLAAASPGVHLLGPLTHAQLLPQLGAAQLAAVPSRTEAFGMSALEALAAGRTVLHPGIPALSEVVGRHGWTAPHDDPRALGSAIARALERSPVTVPVDAVSQFEWPHVLGAYRAVYEQLLRR